MFLLTVSRLRAVGLYHDLKPLPPIEQVTHMPIQVSEVFIAPNIEKLATNYDALYDLPTVQTDKANLFLEKSFTCRYPLFGTKFYVLTRIHPR